MHGKINKEWHARHKMPKNPTGEQRIAWHVDHARNCGCREIGVGVAALFRKHGIPIPNTQKIRAHAERLCGLLEQARRWNALSCEEQRVSYRRGENGPGPPIRPLKRPSS